MYLNIISEMIARIFAIKQAVILGKMMIEAIYSMSRNRFQTKWNLALKKFQMHKQNPRNFFLKMQKD